MAALRLDDVPYFHENSDDESDAYLQGDYRHSPKRAAAGKQGRVGLHATNKPANTYPPGHWAEDSWS